MKKLLTIAIILILGVNLFASFVSTNTLIANGLFDYPALLSKHREKTSFAFKLNYFTDVDNIKFLADPVTQLSKQSDSYISYLLKQNTDFYSSHKDILELFNSYDANSPTFDSNYPKASVDAFKRYLESSYPLLDNERKAFIVKELYSSYPTLIESNLNTSLNTSLSLYGYNTLNPFAWGYSFNTYFTGSNSLLSTEVNRLDIDARVNLAYSFDITSKLHLGLSFSPMLSVYNVIDNINFINARVSNNPALLFSNDFNFGTGFTTNFGLSYDLLDNLIFNLDFRNLPSLQSFYYIGLTDIATGNLNFIKDKNIYILEPDVVLTTLYSLNDKAKFSLEIGEVLSQTLKHNKDTSYEIDYYKMLKLSASVIVNKNFTFVAKAQNNLLELNFKLPHFVIGVLLML